MTRFILYNPMWKEHYEVEKVLSEKPATWERFEHVEGGKLKILKMEHQEFREACEKKEEGKLGKKEAYKSAIHLAAAAIQYAYSVRGENHDRV